MGKIAAFFKLIRWPNLFFIALTQVLFYYCIFFSKSINTAAPQNNILFWLLVVASIFIAAAGNIINDYFDLKIDTINRPDRVLVNGVFKRRTAILWHLLFSILGVALSFYISIKTGNYIIVVGNILAVVALWFYSTNFKRNTLIGNIVIAGLTAWVVKVVYFFAGASLHPWNNVSDAVNQPRFFKFFIIYAGFAFIITLIREVIKDLEDMEGDMQNGCHTMPIAWGVNAAKVFAGVWIAVCLGAIFIISIYAWQIGWWHLSLYSLMLVVLPLLYILLKLKKASAPSEYHRISTVIKFVIFTGIVSMIFFLF